MVNYTYPNIEAERIRLGITQEQLTEQLNCTRKSYYNWLNNGNIPCSILIALADIFDCSIDYLLGRTRNPVKA